jgi:hypothetical protein
MNHVTAFAVLMSYLGWGLEGQRLPLGAAGKEYLDTMSRVREKRSSNDSLAISQR